MNSKVHATCASNAHSVCTPFLTLLFVIGCSLVGYSQNTIYTVAGGGSAAGPALGPNADLPAPSAVAKDASGNLYIADSSADYVFKVDGSGNLTIFAGIGSPREHPIKDAGLQATQAGLNAPGGIAVDPTGIVYIADTANFMIRKVALNGVITSIAGNAKLCQDPTTACGDGAIGRAAQLAYPAGVATDAAGNVYIADSVDNRIRVVNVGKTTITIAGVSIAAGNIGTVAGTGAPCATPVAPSCGDGGAPNLALLNDPRGVAVDSAGNIYISDSGDRRIRKVDVTTGLINPYAGTGNPCMPSKGCGDGGAATAANLSNPFQISVDASGNLFLTDPPENKIREVNGSTLIIMTVAGNGHSGFSGDTGLAASAMLNATRGVTVDASGNVFIADAGNQRIREFTVGGKINTVAGGGSGNDGGVAPSAILGGGRGVALDFTGNLYIADTYNNRIRQVSPSNPPTSFGTISTIVGTGIAGYLPNALPAFTELNFPSSVVLDSTNNVYMADTGNLVIREYSPATNSITTVAGIPAQGCAPPSSACGDGGLATQAKLGLPTSIALDSAANIYIADASTNRIRVVNTGTAAITVAGVVIPPKDIQTVAGTGTACTNPAAGQCGDGGLATSALLNMPFGVAVDASGNIFIADTGDNRIREVASTGKIVAYAFKGATNFGPMNIPALNAAYNTPHYLALDPHGNLYVSGSDFDFVIVRIDAVNHFVIPVAGIATDPKFYGVDGDGGLATLAHVNPAAVAIDGFGHLYVADDGNNRAREVLLTPSSSLSVSTLTFVARKVGTTSPPQNVVLSNSGSDDLYISGTPVSGPFALQSSTCANNIVPPLSNCTFKITFTPIAVGIVSGSITFNDNAFGSPSQVVTLNGTGQ